MAEITAAAVKALRQRTDLPMMECKKALVEADGDAEKAVEILKQQFKKIQDNALKTLPKKAAFSWPLSRQR